MNSEVYVTVNSIFCCLFHTSCTSVHTIETFCFIRALFSAHSTCRYDPLASILNTSVFITRPSVVYGTYLCISCVYFLVYCVMCMFCLCLPDLTIQVHVYLLFPVFSLCTPQRMYVADILFSSVLTLTAIVSLLYDQFQCVIFVLRA